MATLVVEASAVVLTEHAVRWQTQTQTQNQSTEEIKSALHAQRRRCSPAAPQAPASARQLTHSLPLPIQARKVVVVVDRTSGRGSLKAKSSKNWIF